MIKSERNRHVFVINSRGKKPRKAPPPPKRTADGKPPGLQSVKKDFK